LANNNENISSATLANRLKRMCDIGLLRTINDPGHSQRKIYCLNSKTIELMPILIDMSVWALKHAPPSSAPISPPEELERPLSLYSKKLVDELRMAHL
jgi:DNA-binding HxlR family transcriptional regulator